MSVLPGKPITIRPKGLTDAIDGTNAPLGSMANLQNLIPSLTTKHQFIPRPAWSALASGAGVLWGAFNWGAANWGGFGNIAGAAQITGLLTVGNVAYGMIAITSGPNNGKDQPFAYNWATQTFYTVSNPGGATALPTTPAATGDWTPPCLNQIAQRIIVTHPGFSGTTRVFGWFDISSFSDATKTGTTHSNTTIDSLSSNVLTAGWQVGMTITGTGIPANTTIVSIASNGLSIVISNAATSGGAGVALTVAGGTPTAPLWASGQTNGTNLSAVPVAVQQFNGRAYFAVSNGLQFSDSGNPCQITNATQAITFQNGLNVTALGGLPLFQTTGGLLQALIAFQADAQMQQITGDSATTNLQANEMLTGVGTLAPNTICNSPLGMMFMAPDGLRYMDQSGKISNPIGIDGEGVVNPFLNAVAPSRMCAAYNNDVYRITVQNGFISGSPYQEYWYHVSRKIWSGPHTSTCDLIQTRESDSMDFLIVPHVITATLASSPVIPTSSSSFVENGSQLQWAYQATLLPDTEDMAENAMCESMIAAAMPSQSSITVLAVNETGNVLNQVQITGPSATAAQWGSSTWGAFQWASGGNSLRQYDIPWTKPLVFKQASISFSGFSAPNLVLGNIYMKIRPLGYRLQAMVATAGGAI